MTNGKPMENQWKTHGEPMGKPMVKQIENQWKTNGKSKGSHWITNGTTMGKPMGVGVAVAPFCLGLDILLAPLVLVLLWHLFA